MESNQDNELSSVFEQAFDSGDKQQAGTGLSKEQINAKITDEMSRKSGHESMEVEEDQEKVVRNLPPAQKEEIVNSKVEGNVFNAGDARFNALMDFSSGSKSVSIVPSDNCYTYKATFLFDKGWNDTEYFSDLYAHMKNTMEKLTPSENLFDFAGKMVDAIDSEIEFVKEKSNEINVISSEQYAKSQFNYKSDTAKFDENMEIYTESLKDIRQQVSGFYYSGSAVLKFLFVTLPGILKKIASIFGGGDKSQSNDGDDDDGDDIGMSSSSAEQAAEKPSGDSPALPSLDGERDRLTGRLFSYASIGEAKQCALENDRPLLVVVGMMPACAECDIFEDRILKDGSEFRDFAKNNGIVVCNVRESTNNLLAKVKKAYKSQVEISSTPYVFLFKVNSGATFKSKVSSALDPSEVTLVGVDEKRYCGGSYTSNGEWAGLGIANGSNSKWNAKTFTDQIKACFPNSGWKSL